MQIPEDGYWKKSKANVHEYVPTYRSMSAGESDFLNGAGGKLEAKMVTSTMIAGSQHFAGTIGIHVPSTGGQAVNSIIEFSVLTRSVETMLNHKKRFRQTLGPIMRRMSMAAEVLPTARLIMANGWHM